MESMFGKDGKKLGFGLMRLPMKDGEVDLETVKGMVDRFLEKGFSYFDTSPVYVGGKSESAAREAIVRRYPREVFQLATKLPIWMVNSKDDLEKYFQISMTSLGVDVIDFYLLHGVSATASDRFPSSNIQKAEQFGAWEFMKQKQKEGKIRHIGFSFHDSAQVLDEFLTTHPEAEFVQLQINYADWEDEVIQSRACYEVARKHGKPVIVMEPIKGGTLVNLRPEVADIFRQATPEASLASWAIRYAASLPGVATVLSGMSSPEQMDDNLSYMHDLKPLTAGENAVVERAVNALRQVETIGCTSCRYCTDGCPRGIDIPGIFTLVNDYRVYRDLAYTKRRYQNRTQNGGKASSCIRCGACENRCPQHLPILRLLQEAAPLLED